MRIQEAAIRLWADQPNAGVADVAAAAGVGRATLYRHFPTRESLLEAIRSQGMTDGEKAMEDCRLDEGSPTKALERLLAAWLELGDRYRVVVANPSAPDNLPARAREEAMGEHLRALVVRGQTAGEFSPTVPALWGVIALGALLVAMIRAVGEGRIAREDAHPLLSGSVLGALSPSDRPGLGFGRRWVVPERDHRDRGRHDRAQHDAEDRLVEDELADRDVAVVEQQHAGRGQRAEQHEADQADPGRAAQPGLRQPVGERPGDARDPREVALAHLLPDRPS